MACKQQAIATTLCEELQASNCVYKSQGACARGIGPPPVYLEKLLTSIALRLTLLKLHIATLSRNFKHCTIQEKQYKCTCKLPLNSLCYFWAAYEFIFVTESLKYNK